MEKTPEINNQIIKMTPYEFDILRNYLGLDIDLLKSETESNEEMKRKIEEASQIKLKYGIEPSDDENSTIQIDVDGEVLEIVNWKGDFGTVIAN
jgi:hypothetical protein